MNLFAKTGGNRRKSAGTIQPGMAVGRYHIQEQLGQGGMATVYRAYDTRLKKDVAVKLIRRSAFGDEIMAQVLARFDQEAVSLARLTHPNIIPIIDFDRYEDSPFLVMPYLSGGTLKDRIEQMAAEDQRMTPAQAARLLLPIARALDYAHQTGVLHRDVKPANILLTASGEPLLSDFGIARILDAEGKTLTATGVGIGTPEYMAPEQGMGQPVPASDQYALGVILYELLTGHKPFTADTPMAVLMKHASAPLPPPRQYAPDLTIEAERVLFTALAKQPENRYASMVAFAQALERLDKLERAQDNAPAASDPENTRVIPAPIVEIPAVNMPAADLPTDYGSADAALAAVAATPPPALTETPLPTPAKARRPWLLVGGILLVLLLMAGGVYGWRSNQEQQAAQRTAVAAAALDAATATAAVEIAQTATQAALMVYIQTVSTPTASPTVEATSTPTVTATLTVPPPVPADTATPTAVPLPDIGSTQVSPVDGMTQMFVPAGEFIMGEPGETGTDRQPQHTVYLDAFWIDRTEVTISQYQQCEEAGACNSPSRTDSYTRSSYYGAIEYTDYPVILISKQDANSYCAWTGRRLPSEAEWEKAARGTDERRYPWGDDELFTIANHCDKNCDYGHHDLNHSDGFADTAPVDSFPGGASPYGALNMAGNVAEWVNDSYNATYYSQSPAANPPGPADGFGWVLRGGSWYNMFHELTVTYRQQVSYDFRSKSIGFRCAQSAQP